METTALKTILAQAANTVPFVAGEPAFGKSSHLKPVANTVPFVAGSHCAGKSANIISKTTGG